MNSNFGKKNNPLIVKKISFSIFVFAAFLIFMLNFVYKEKFIKINFFLKKYIDHTSLNNETLLLNFKKIHFNFRIFFDNIEFGHELYTENLELKNQINLLKQEIQKNLDFLNFKKKIERKISKNNSENFGFLPGFIFFDSKNEILISIDLKNLTDLEKMKLKSKKFLNNLEKNLIIDHDGPLATVKKIYEIDKNFVIFAQKITHKDFKIPIIINEKNIGIFNGKENNIDNLNSLTGLNLGDEISLMIQPEKIPHGFKIGNIKKIDKNSSAIQINFSRDFSKNLKNANILIIFYSKNELKE